MNSDKTEIPRSYSAFVRRFPALEEGHRQIAAALDAAGPLDARTRALIKLGICVGAGLESAVQSHVRKGLDHGLGRDEIEQALVLGMNSIGFPRTVAAWCWAQAVLDPE